MLFRDIYMLPYRQTDKKGVIMSMYKEPTMKRTDDDVLRNEGLFFVAMFNLLALERIHDAMERYEPTSDEWAMLNEAARRIEDDITNPSIVKVADYNDINAEDRARVVRL